MPVFFQKWSRNKSKHWDGLGWKSLCVRFYRAPKNHTNQAQVTTVISAPPFFPGLLCLPCFLKVNKELLLEIAEDHGEATLVTEMIEELVKWRWRGSLIWLNNDTGDTNMQNYIILLTDCQNGTYILFGNVLRMHIRQLSLYRPKNIYLATSS